MPTFFVFNQADDEGFHEIKDESGKIVATAADTDDQTRITLEVMGHPDAEAECVYNKDDWDNIGKTTS